jgi:drug/metabolite transporter (DMT)-like permease
MSGHGLQKSVVATMLLLALIWGSNLAVVKLSTQEMSPIFMASIRSIIAGLLVALWMKYKGVPLFTSRRLTAHGVVIGILFGAEFAVVYSAISITLASRAVILLYTAPFWVALMAHFFLEGDRLSRPKLGGLVLAFCGVAVLFVDKRTFNFSKASLVGDMMALSGAFIWGATTVYVKRYLSGRVHAFQSLFYQHAFGALFMFCLAVGLEDKWILGFSFFGGFSLFYQSFIIAFITFTIWFALVHKHPVSLLHAFTFLTPIAGVIFSGVLILNEPVGWDLILALTMVCLGLVLVNR